MVVDYGADRVHGLGMHKKALGLFTLGGDFFFVPSNAKAGTWLKAERLFKSMCSPAFFCAIIIK